MPLGSFRGLFFILLAIAALTSSVSLLEVPTSYVMDRWNWGRTKAVVVISALVMLIGLPSALSFGIVPGLTDIGGKLL